MHRTNMDQTLVLIKPDALKNSLTGYVLSQLSEFHTGLRFAGAKIVNVSKMLAEEHYAEHLGKVFFPSLIEYITGASHYPDQPWKRRVIALVYQGENAPKRIRELAGPTNPHAAREEKPGSIRSLGTLVDIKDASGKVIGQRIDNLIHASATLEEAEREIKLWFKPCDIPPLMRPYQTEICHEHYYYKDGTILHQNYEPGSVCLMAPGDTVWASDMEALKLHTQGKPTATTIGSVAAKYLINQDSAE
ncbi:MAG TPA: nucleoside-diphosphate kinase [bacterium]|nr:nucleoside-diphosphate kinase [bacterium]